MGWLARDAPLRERAGCARFSAPGGHSRLIILGLMMREMNGSSFRAEQLKGARLGDILVVVMTASLAAQRGEQGPKARGAGAAHGDGGAARPALGPRTGPGSCGNLVPP
jgi:hypothetical protein